ncbi:MAG TPA: MarR family transcriptional regulator [Terriglobia bacterium]|nr:MarR family transcriptional regulator [Terriglobia bacterium]
MEKFVTTWGEMASKWCVNRTVAEIHALYILSAQPLSVDDIASSLVCSRSNVSASLREMQSWGLISPVHVRGDRKQYYEAKKDPWEIFRIILDEQRRRVIDPAVAMFQECLDEQMREAPEDEYTAERMREVLSFFNAFNNLCNELQRLPKGPIQNLFKITATIRELLG